MMTGRDLLKAALKCKPVDRVPWVPFVGCHAGSLVGVGADAFLQSAQHIINGVQSGIDRYKPDGVPVVFDLQIEAEIFGCELNWSADNPPAVTNHPLAEGVELSSLHVPTPDQGRLKVALEATRHLREANQDVALYGLITGPFTLALHLLGTEIFMRMFDAPESIHEIMDFCSKTAMAVSGYYIDAGADVIAVVDPMTSQIGPDQFREFVTPHLAPVFDSVREQGSIGSLFVCGHAQKNIEVMCDSRPDNISIDENIALDYVRDICIPRGISFGGNLQLTTVLLLGSPEDAQRNAVECLKVGGSKGFILAPGCDLPYATPPANIEAVSRLVHDPYEREVAETLVKTAGSTKKLDMSEYGQSDKVIVDIITLDSEGCAPCQYMVEAVKDIAPQFEGIVEWREHKIKNPEALTIMGAFFVKNIPTICIDGRIAFVSQIPAKEKLIQAVQNRILDKLRMKIRRRHSVVYLLGDATDETYQELKSNTEQAMLELGADVELELKEINDESRYADFGVLPDQAPVTIIARYSMKSAGKAAPTAIIKEWLKEL